MTIIQEIASFSRDLDVARSKVMSLNSRVAPLLSKREGVVSSPPHADEIAEAYCQGVAEAARDFEERFASFSINPGLTDASSVLGASAAIYFMRDLIPAKVPALVQRLCPDAKRGMSLQDRRRALADIDGQLRQLWNEREALRVQLSLQMNKLRALKNEAFAEGDRQARVAIEREEMDLPREIADVRRDQDELLQLLDAANG